MKLGQLIKQLQEFEAQHGSDVECYANGEHGFDDTEMLGSDMVNIGEAQAELPEDYGTDNDTIVVHIGGY